MFIKQLATFFFFFVLAGFYGWNFAILIEIYVKSISSSEKVFEYLAYIWYLL